MPQANIYIYPYKASSEGAIALSEELDCYRINRDRTSGFTYASDKVVINWGSGDRLPTEVARCKIINKPEAIAKAVDKIATFRALEAELINIPTWTVERSVAMGWYNGGRGVYCRRTIAGSDGQGLSYHKIRAGEGALALPNSVLYTLAVPISTEYRVNVVGSEVVTFQKKVQVSGRETYDNLIRTTSGGWGFEVVDEFNVPPCVDQESTAAIAALGLDFGGVDIVYNTALNKAFVLEVNTAPHLTPYSCTKYANALKVLANSLL